MPNEVPSIQIDLTPEYKQNFALANRQCGCDRNFISPCHADFVCVAAISNRLG